MLERCFPALLNPENQRLCFLRGSLITFTNQWNNYFNCFQISGITFSTISHMLGIFASAWDAWYSKFNS